MGLGVALHNGRLGAHLSKAILVTVRISYVVDVYGPVARHTFVCYVLCMTPIPVQSRSHGCYAICYGFVFSRVNMLWQVNWQLVSKKHGSADSNTTYAAVPPQVRSSCASDVCNYFVKNPA